VTQYKLQPFFEYEKQKDKELSESISIYQRSRHSSMKICNDFGMTNYEHWSVDEGIKETDLEPTLYETLFHLGDHDVHIEPFIIDSTSVQEIQVCFCMIDSLQISPI
jgi:hypothetical protein